MIRWNRPCPLEEFLLPHRINWTVPEWLLPSLDDPSKSKFGGDKNRVPKLSASDGDDTRIVQARLQMDDGGQSILETLVVNDTNPVSDYMEFYHDMFRMMFKPAPPIAVLVEQQMKKYGMVPGEYTVAHFRAFYKIEKRLVRTTHIKACAINAMNCASRLSPGTQIFFASDSGLAMETAEEYAKEKNQSFARNDQQNDPIHLDFASRGNKTYAISEYYDSFVDLLLMGSGRCVTFGQG